MTAKEFWIIWKNQKKEVVKDDFMMEKEGKKEYDRRTKERNETTWKKKAYMESFVVMLKVRICKDEHRSSYYGCSKSSTENKLDESKQRWSWLSSLPYVEHASLLMSYSCALQPAFTGRFVESLKKDSLETDMNWYCITTHGDSSKYGNPLGCRDSDHHKNQA